MSAEQLFIAYDDRTVGRARKSDPVSSRVAARTVDADGQIARIHADLQVRWHPACAYEIAQSTGIPSNEVGSRLPVMQRKGMAQMVGMGLNHRGQPVQLWAYRTPGHEVTVETGGYL